MKTVNALSVFLFGLCLVLTAICAFAVIDDDYWKTDHTYVNFYAIIGKITGITNLRKGDEVAAFDNAGYCYGKGVVVDENNNYALSLYPAETGGTVIGPDGTEIPIPDDFAIPGFEVGDEVNFKVYVKIEGQPYPLEPVTGSTYRFVPQAGRHGFPPARLNLAYNVPDDDSPPGDDDTPPPSGDDTPKDTTRIISGGLPYVKDDEKPPEVKGPPPVIREEVFVEKEAPGMGVKDTPPDYYPTPPPAGRGKVSRGAAPVPKEKPIARAPYRKPYEPTTVKKKPLKVPAIEMPAIKGWPLSLRILLVLLLMGSLIFAVRKLLKMQEENKKE